MASSEKLQNFRYDFFAFTWRVILWVMITVYKQGYAKISHVKRLFISFHKMYGFLNLYQTAYLLYLIISRYLMMHLQTAENKKKTIFEPQEQCTFNWIYFNVRLALWDCLMSFDEIWIYTVHALSGTVNRSFYEYRPAPFQFWKPLYSCNYLYWFQD